MKKIFLLLLLFLVFSVFAIAQDNCGAEEKTCSVKYEEAVSASNVKDYMAHNPDAICILYFYTINCPKCAQLKPFVEKLEDDYGNKIHINKLEISHNLENYQLYNQYCGVQNIPLEARGVPMAAIDNKFFMGLDHIQENLEHEIKTLLDSGYRVCPLPGVLGCQEVEPGDVNPVASTNKITLPLVLGAGMVDGVNPCAFAVLIFLLTFLLGISSTKKRMVKAGIAYIFAVYVTYLLAGLGLLIFVQISGMSLFVTKAAAAFALFAGLINVKDYFWYGKGFSLEIPRSKKSVIEKWTKKANVFAAVVLGFLVSMFELPCTGGVYLAILAMLASTATKISALYYLLVYNIMFVLPLGIILLLVTKGMKAEHIENWRNAKKNWMRLVMGLFLLALGLGLLLGWF